MCGCWEVEVNGLGTGQTVPLKANRGDTGKVHTRGSSGCSPGLSRSAGQVPSIAFLRKEGVQGVGLQKTGRPAVRGGWNGASRDAPVVTYLGASGKSRCPGSMSICTKEKETAAKALG